MLFDAQVMEKEVNLFMVAISKVRGNTSLQSLYLVLR